jgi:hypothetical protein
MLQVGGKAELAFVLGGKTTLTISGIRIIKYK